MLTITVTGKPIAQARPRFVRRGKFVSTYNPQETEAGRFIVSVMSQLPAEFKPLTGPLNLSCAFYLPIPATAPKKKKEAMLAGRILHTKRPDCSNYIKFVEDCLNGVVWLDDSQVVRIVAEKVYAEIPSTEIVISELNQQQNTNLGGSVRWKKGIGSRSYTSPESAPIHAPERLVNWFGQATVAGW